MNDAVNIIGSGLLALIPILIKLYYSERKTRKEIAIHSNRNVNAMTELTDTVGRYQRNTDSMLNRIVVFIKSNRENNNKKFQEIEERIERIENAINIQRKKK